MRTSTSQLILQSLIEQEHQLQQQLQTQPLPLQVEFGTYSIHPREVIIIH